MLKSFFLSLQVEDTLLTQTPQVSAIGKFNQES